MRYWSYTQQFFFYLHLFACRKWALEVSFKPLIVIFRFFCVTETRHFNVLSLLIFWTQASCVNNCQPAVNRSKTAQAVFYCMQALRTILISWFGQSAGNKLSRQTLVASTVMRFKTLHRLTTEHLSNIYSLNSLNSYLEKILFSIDREISSSTVPHHLKRSFPYKDAMLWNSPPREHYIMIYSFLMRGI